MMGSPAIPSSPTTRTLPRCVRSRTSWLSWRSCGLSGSTGRRRCDAADALGYAHRQGLVHPDIQPETLLISAAHAGVATFVIARAVTEAGGSRLTETGISLMTSAYRRPEPAAGGYVDGGRDLDSLG